MEGHKNAKLIKLYDEAIARMQLKIEDLVQIKNDVSSLTRSRLGFICDENSSKYDRRLFTKCDVSDFFAELDAERKIHETKITELEELRAKAKQQPESSSSSEEADIEEPVRPAKECPRNAAAGAKRKYKNRKNSGNNNNTQQKTTTTQKYYPQRQKKPNNYGRSDNHHHHYNRHYYNCEYFGDHQNGYGGFNGGMPFYGYRSNPSNPPFNRNVYCPPRMMGNIFVPNQHRRTHAANNYRNRNLTYL